jgi:hypothetical protein
MYFLRISRKMLDQYPETVHAFLLRPSILIIHKHLLISRLTLVTSSFDIVSLNHTVQAVIGMAVALCSVSRRRHFKTCRSIIRVMVMLCCQINLKCYFVSVLSIYTTLFCDLRCLL